MMDYVVYADARNLSHEEWLEARRQGIGGSDAGAIMGVHPYKGMFGVWADKKGYGEAVEDNEAMRQGRDLEGYVAWRFSEKTGLKVRREYGMMRSRNHPFMLANIDRRIKGERAGLECKTSRDIYMKRYRNGEFPMEYYCQCLHYMAVTGWDAWYLAVLVYGTDLLIFKICREEAQDDINQLIEAEAAFWTRYMEDGRTPPPDDLPATGRVLDGMWMGETGGSMDATVSQDATIDELIALRAEKRALEKRITGIENRLKAEMEEVTELRGTGGLVTWKPQTQRRISEKRLKELYPMVDVSRIKDEVQMRRFCVRTEEEIDG